MKKIIFIVCILALLIGVYAAATTRYLKNSGSLTNHSIGIPLTEVSKGGTFPTKSSLGTTPTVQGLLFDATDELYQLQFHVPDCWDGRSNFLVDLYIALNAGETTDDSIAFSADYIAVTKEVDAVTKTSTAITATQLVVAGCQGQGCFYNVVFTLDYTDTDNPLNIEDLVIMEIHRTNITNVAGTLLVAVDAHFTHTF